VVLFVFVVVVVVEQKMSIFLFSKNAQVPTETPCRGTSLLMLDDDISPRDAPRVHTFDS
jgi:hypothetical protein